MLGEIATACGPVRWGLANAGQTVVCGLYSGAIGFADVDSMEGVGRIDLAGPAVSLEIHDDDTVTTCVQSDYICYAVSVTEGRILHSVKVRDGERPDPALLLDQAGVRASKRRIARVFGKPARLQAARAWAGHSNT